MRLVAAALAGVTISLLLLVGSLQASAVGSGVVEEGEASAFAAADSAVVDITADGFDPPIVTVAVGGTVSWTNGDSDAHSVVGDPGSGLESPYIERWGMYSRTFNIAGTIAYHDGLHPELTGTINVADDDGSVPAPAAPAPPDRADNDPAPIGDDLPLTGPGQGSIAGQVNVDAGMEWFGNSGFQNGVHEITIQAGDTVQWNIVEGVHTVYECGDNWSGANSCTAAAWSSDILTAGGTFSQQFNILGAFPYLCTLHPLTMRGVITVEDSSPPAGDAAPPPAPDNGPAAAPPVAEGANSPANAPSVAAGPGAVPNAGFGPSSEGSGLGDYFSLSVVIMAAAGVTFLASSLMLINQRVSGARAAAGDGWTPRMVEPTRLRQERVNAPPTTAASGASMNATPTIRPWQMRGNLAAASRLQGGQVTDHVTGPQERPAMAPDDLEMLQVRLASIRDRFARLARKVEQR